jgi:hypothetical protein
MPSPFGWDSSSPAFRIGGTLIEITISDMPEII